MNTSVKPSSQSGVSFRGGWRIWLYSCSCFWLMWTLEDSGNGSSHWIPAIFVGNQDWVPPCISPSPLQVFVLWTSEGELSLSISLWPSNKQKQWTSCMLTENWNREEESRRKRRPQETRCWMLTQVSDFHRLGTCRSWHQWRKRRRLSQRI